LFGARGVARRRILPGEARDPEQGFWARLARSIMRRPLLYLAAGSSALVALAVPAFFLQLTPGSTFGIPRTPPAIRGFDVLRKVVGPGAVAPTQVVVDSGRPAGIASPGVRAGLERVVAELRRDPEPARVFARVPLARAPVEGRAAQPALGRRELRDAGARLPLGPRPRAARPLPRPAGRGLDPDLPVRDAVRALDGLRGVPRHAHARDVGRGR